MPQPSFEMEESRSVTPWVNRRYFESPRASSFLGLQLVKARHKNLAPLFSGVKPDPMVGSGRYAESIPIKSPLGQSTSALRTKQYTGQCSETKNTQYAGQRGLEGKMFQAFSPVCVIFLLMSKFYVANINERLINMGFWVIPKYFNVF